MTHNLGPDEDMADEANEQLQEEIDEQESGDTSDAVESGDASE